MYYSKEGNIRVWIPHGVSPVPVCHRKAGPHGAAFGVVAHSSERLVRVTFASSLGCPEEGGWTAPRVT
jgi:hypothetical protein